MAKKFMFDVESVSLHGVGFAYGFVVIDEVGQPLDSGECYSLEGAAQATLWVRDNVIPHLPKSLRDLVAARPTSQEEADAAKAAIRQRSHPKPLAECGHYYGGAPVLKPNPTAGLGGYSGDHALECVVWSVRELRDRFWSALQKWKAEGAQIMGDVIWPVEANFLSACIADGGGSRDWDGPFPLLDAAPLLELVGKDLDRAAYSGLSGLRKHNPLDDAKASAAALMKAERELGLVK